MFQYGSGSLPADFCGFFTLVKSNHDNTTRLAFTNAYSMLSHQFVQIMEYLILDFVDLKFGALSMNL